MPGHAPNLRIQSPWCRVSKILPLLLSFAGAATAQTAQETCHGVSDAVYCQALLDQDPGFCSNPSAYASCKILCELCPDTVAPSTPAPTTLSPTGSPTCVNAASPAICAILVANGCENPNVATQCRGSCNNCVTESPTGSPTTSDPTASPSGLPTTSNPTTSPTLMPTTSTPTTSVPTLRPTTPTPTTLVPTVSPTASTTADLPTLPTVSPTLPPTDDVGEVNQVAGASSGDPAGVATDVVVGIIVAAVLLLVLGIAIGRWQRSTQQPGQQHIPDLVWRSQSRGGGAKDGFRQQGGTMATVENDNVGRGTGIDNAGYIDIGQEGPAVGFDSPTSRQSTTSVDLELFALARSSSADPHGGTDQDQDPGFNLWT